MGSLSYLAYNAQEPYCHLWLVRFYNIFPQYLIKDTIKRKDIVSKLFVLYNFV